MIKNKIVLIKPINDLRYKAIPLGLLHIGTILKKEGYTVSIIDVIKHPDYKKIIVKEIENALLVGLTALTTEVKNAIEISDYVKNINIKIPIIWGGWHPTLFPEQICSDKSVDFVCIGEGEYTILKLVKALESGLSFENIDGLAYKDKGVVKVNPPIAFVKLEELPQINYDLIDISKYIKATARRNIPYQSSRGCPHRCKFCINSVTGNQKYRFKSAQKVVDEIEYLINKYNLNFIAFIDDNFFVNIKRVRKICEEIINRKLNIKWFAECRADYFRENFVNEEFLQLATESGLSELTIGAESGSQRILNLLKKDITVKQILNSSKMLSKFPIRPRYGFIIGIYGQTKEEIIASVDLANKVKKICPNSKYKHNILTPYPGCELTDELVEKGLFKEPKTLREWSNNNIRKLYAGRYSTKPWQDNSRFIYNVSYFSKLGSTFPDQNLKKFLSNFRYIYKYYDVFFVLIARFRLKHLIFGLPIDRFLYRIFIKIKKKIFNRNGKSMIKK